MPSAVAIHEAGHAVVAVLLRRYFRTVSIIPDRVTAGRVSGWGEVDYRSTRNLRRMAVVLYASFAAELHYRAETGDSPHLSTQEREGFRKDHNALKALGHLHDPDVIGESTSLVIEHWDAVLRVAEALDDAKALTHKRVAERVMALA
jgi:hypothetical protein